VNPLESAYVNNLTRRPVQITLILKTAATDFGSSNTSLALLSHVSNKRNYNQDVWRNTGVWTCRIQPRLPCVAQAEFINCIQPFLGLGTTYGTVKHELLLPSCISNALAQAAEWTANQKIENSIMHILQTLLNWRFTFQNSAVNSDIKTTANHLFMNT